MQSAREDEMAHWLEQHGIPNVSKFTAALVEANVENDALERLIGHFSVPVLHDVLTRIVAAVITFIEPVRPILVEVLRREQIDG